MAVPNDAAQNIRLKHVLLFLPWLALLGWFSRVAWFLCDDAFISFRYVRNLLAGHGLVFNPGEYVEGYSNFLWVLELAAVWGALGVPPEQAAPWLSAACTAATVAALLWWVARLPHLQHRGMTAWMALGLLCSSATFAVWTSGGGLETRQFTLFIVLAVVCLSLYRDSRRGLLAASLSLAAAALTRPEGPLLAALCFGWFAVQRMADTGRRNPDWRRLLYLAAPFVVLVGAHFLWRYAYYGEWLPNTYYAKHVRPWYESGFRYLQAAALETGLYLLIPLSFAALRERLREYRDGTYALALLLVGVHAAYVLRIGGDHFEYRPLDFYWPLLALPAAAGIVHLGSRIACRLRPLRRLPRLPAPSACALVLFLPVLFYCNAFQGALLFAAAKVDEHIAQTRVELDDLNAGWLMAAPGMPMLTARVDNLRRSLIRQAVAMRFVEHREFVDMQLGRWQRYENMDRGVIPGDALWSNGSIGMSSYYVAGVKVVDKHGLTDAVVARNPVSWPNRERSMAHDRHPPVGYLEERGVNIVIHAAESSVDRALSRAKYALKIGPDLWMPFDSPYRRWVNDRFAGRDLRVRDRDYRAELVGDRRPVIRSDWDVYLSENSLVYVKEPCASADTEAKFFLALFPADANDLSGWRKQYGFANRDFYFVERGSIFDGRCTATAALPEYAVTRIATGQYVPVDGGYHHFWEVEMRLDDAGALIVNAKESLEAALRSDYETLVSGEPVMRSDFDVYLSENKLTYVKEPCASTDTEATFFLHLHPVDANDLPEHRRQYGFDNLDFDFGRRGMVLDGKCMARIPLPEYAIARIATGQYVHVDGGYNNLWAAGFDVVGPADDGQAAP